MDHFVLHSKYEKGFKIAEKSKAIGKKIEKAAQGTLLFLCICIFCGLTYYSARYTMVEISGIPLPVDNQDNAGLNLLVLAAVTGAVFLLHGILRNEHLRFIRQRMLAWMPYMIGIVAIYVYIISVIWVINCHIAPIGDGEVLCNVARRMITGNYVDMKNEGNIGGYTGYMAVFPHQFSLLSVIHLILAVFGPWKYEIFQHINAICMPILFYSGYKFLQLICENLEVVIYYIIFFVGCVPLFLYVPYVYGEIISITFTMVLMWQTVRYCKTGKKSCFLWGTAAIVLACMVRKNSFIILIAVGIVLLIHSVRKANLWGVVWILVMALMVSGSDKLIHAYYEKASGIEVEKGVPYISWIRMGLQDTWAGPGWFDNSSIEEFIEHGYNTEQTALAEKEHIREILKGMWEDKAYSIDFFRRKILTQWNSPKYGYTYELQNFDCNPEELPDFVSRIYYYDEISVQTYLNRYQFVLYFYAAVSAVALFVGKKKESCLADYLLYIAIVGGFLFSALWEASSRYVLPYVVYMVPLAAIGICQLTKISGKGMGL